MRYRFWLICINYNFDFLVLYKMYFQNYFARRSIILESFTSHLQHSRPCCIRYTNSRLRLEFVYLIQHGRSCCKYYIYNNEHKKLMLYLPKYKINYLQLFQQTRVYIVYVFLLRLATILVSTRSFQSKAPCSTITVRISFSSYIQFPINCLSDWLYALSPLLS